MKKKIPSSGQLPAAGCTASHFNAKDLRGKRFGKLEVVEEHGRTARRSITWLCLCDCGGSVIRVSSTLLCGKSTSCGCNIRSEESRHRKSLAQRKEGSSIRKAYRAYAAAANKRGLVFDIDIEYFEELTASLCFYCGEEPSQIKKSTFGHHVANGIDRLDNGVGYIAGNCVPCCSACNFMKRSSGLDEFLDRCRRIHAVHVSRILEEVSHSSTK